LPFAVLVFLNYKIYTTIKESEKNLRQQLALRMQETTKRRQQDNENQEKRKKDTLILPAKY